MKRAIDSMGGVMPGANPTGFDELSCEQRPVKHRKLTGLVFIEVISTILPSHFRAKDLAVLSRVSKLWCDRVRKMVWVKKLNSDCYDLWRWVCTEDVTILVPEMIIAIKVFGNAPVQKMGHDNHQSVTVFPTVVAYDTSVFKSGTHTCPIEHTVRIKRGKNNSIGVHPTYCPRCTVRDGSDTNPHHTEVHYPREMLDAITQIITDLVSRKV